MEQLIAAPLRVGVAGAGFWATFQVAAWLELPGVEVVAITNRTRARAEALAERFGIPHVDDDVEGMLATRSLDVLDVITDVGSHARHVEAGARAGVDVVCQKPLAPSLAEAEALLETCRAAGVSLTVHENWRWQAPLLALQRELASGVIGRPFRSRLQFSSSFPVFDNQPFLAAEERFILADVGSHVLDVARVLHGEPDALLCHASRVNPAIRGEDVATVLLRFGDLACTVELSYASRLEHERFPETFALIEGELGSIELGPDAWLRTTTEQGTLARRHPPRHYAWADPAYDVVHASIVACHEDIVSALRDGRAAGTDAADNLRTVRLVEAAYASAASGEVVALRDRVLAAP